MERCETCRWWSETTGVQVDPPDSKRFGDCDSVEAFHAINGTPKPDFDFGCVCHTSKEAPHD